MYGDTIIQQGRFTADGTDKILKVRSDIDWIQIYNTTEWAASNSGSGYKYEWQRGLGSTGLMHYHPAADHTSAVDTSANAFTLIDSSAYNTGAWISVTAGTNATIPIYSTGATTNLFNGGIVRIKGTDHTDINGIDFSVDTVTSNTSFRLANTLATAPGVVAGASGFWKLVAPNIEVYRLFAPATRNISNITQAASAVVTTLVDHDYAVGEKVRFKVGSGFGMTEIDNLEGTITAVSTSTFTVDIDSSGFTAFQFPTAAEMTTTPQTYASVTPSGYSTEDTYSGTAGGSITSQGFIGMVLAAGATSPAGSNNDVIYWKAGKSFSIDNE